ncbi:MAG: sulfite exporter TauE/SafE family protein [Cyanobacteria bacterium J003]|uniref:sulfite exporter TauE/SafE family protein n=1 Tax=Thermosynechococcus sp. M3746_W2019_013 TaxID=2747806 RepID=UPI000F199554|nr:sulfite exporter TauE/SafE family protein [Thermosynechococcus sp. M3746_W2019_013]RMH67101.1 MAG: sulfite exporter TauE/SafE family protein [Cyanobacteria bacterium J003]HIK22129.1 sulfite exporter TauE/SafE family protein [Thermosynechococcus sp. M3746_W2019_013]
MLSYWIGHGLAIAIGLSLGLLGGGGSVLALPVLVYVMGIETKVAIPMTLVIVGSVSLLAVIPQWRRGYVNLRLTLIFGSATMVGAYLGARLAALPWITDTVQLLLFAVAMMVAAILMIRRQQRPPAPELTPPESSLESQLYAPPVCKYCWLWLPTEGLGVGVLTGLVGVGGGFAIVPALVLLGKIPIRQAIGTSLLIITINSVAAVWGYLGTVTLDPRLTLTLTLAAAGGSVVGSYLSHRISAKRLQQGFGYFLIGIAAFVILKTLLAPPQRSKSSSLLPRHYLTASVPTRPGRT